MDLPDVLLSSSHVLWTGSHDTQLNELRELINRERSLRDSDVAQQRQLVEENLELKLRLGLLLQLLISKGVITAEEYAAMIAEAQRKP